LAVPGAVRQQGEAGHALSQIACESDIIDADAGITAPNLFERENVVADSQACVVQPGVSVLG